MPDGDLAVLVDGNTEFALGLQRALAGPDANLFYSPHSISLTLAMAYAGARGETERQMADALRLRLPGERLHPAFNALALALASQPAEDGFRLNVANSLWGQRGHAFLPEFRDALAVNYGEEVREADFHSDPEEARNRINDWAAGETGERVEEIVPPGGISPDTRLVLANAIYFNAEWQRPFEEDATASRPFFLLDGSEVDAPMMRQTEGYDYIRGDGYQAVELPYRGGRMAMTILLPDAGRFSEFEGWLDGPRLQGILERLQSTYVRLTMPKFGVESSFSFAGALEELGITAAFDDETADFSGMDGRSCPDASDGCLVISEALHRAFVSVDERGTEAAAATAVTSDMVTSSLGKPEPVLVDVNRPFIFLVRDRATEAVLFLGRILKPAQPRS